MLSATDALDRILEAASPLHPERVPLSEAAGRTLAEALSCREDLPPFDASAMDGYAVRAEDCPALLPVIGSLRAGSPKAGSLGSRQAARILTGAPVPEGADAVVMQEAVELRETGTVAVPAAPRPGQHIRRRGEDVRAGAPLLAEGTLLRPYEIALLAAQGFESVLVRRRPRVAVLPTGDELSAGAGGIRDANGPALRAAFERWGCSCRAASPVGDDPSALRDILGGLLESCDVLAVTGGVSVGDHDHTKAVLEGLGVRRVFWKVAIKPGKPLYFGTRGKTLVFGLPGNPVAALVCAEEFMRPALERLKDARLSHESYHLRGKALNDYPKPADRRQYIFCRALRGPAGYELEIIRPQGSAMLAMASRANALAIGPEGLDRVRAGDGLAFRWLK